MTNKHSIQGKVVLIAGGAKNLGGLLARDLAEHPERLQAVDAGLAQRIQALVGGVEVDLDAPLSADDE